MSECNDCTLCCLMLEIPELDKKAGEVCKYCEPEKGCKIYPTRPKSCREFRCMYHQMETCREDVRPDKSNVIWEKVNDNIIFGTQHKEYNLTKSAENQIQDFGSKSQSNN